MKMRIKIEFILDTDEYPGEEDNLTTGRDFQGFVMEMIEGKVPFPKSTTETPGWFHMDEREDMSDLKDSE